MKEIKNVITPPYDEISASRLINIFASTSEL